MNSVKDPLLQPFQLRHLSLRNRIISTSHAPAYAEQGHPRDQYRLYHEEKAKGGVALTMIGGSTNISPDSPSVFGQLYAGDDSILPWFEKLTSDVKQHGAAIMCQITHMGRRTSSDDGHWLPVIGPSETRERAHRSYPKTMEDFDLQRVIKHFSETALRCKQGGFDGIEILSHSHLLGQFLSPLVNKREDDYGGSLNNRLRLTLQVLDAIRDKVGTDFIVGLRITGDELTEGGLESAECIDIAKLLEASGMVDYLNILAGAPYDDLGLASWVPPMGMPSAPHLSIAADIRKAVSIPIMHAGGIADIATARWAITDGLVDLVGMTRAQIADPHLVNKISQGKEAVIRPCVGMGFCVDRVNQGKQALCGHNPATGREQRLSHIIKPNKNNSKNAVVVGAGPAGLEAARVLSLRGLKVTLFEASNKLGGQLILASKGSTRNQLWGVADWLIEQVTKLDIDIRTNNYAEADDILAENPDLVVIATGGMPETLDVNGTEYAVSSWDVLYGETLKGEVLVFDDHGDHQAAVTANVIANSGSEVLFVTPDRTTLHNLGPTNSSVVHRDLYLAGVSFQTDLDIVDIKKNEGRLSVTLQNVLTQQKQTRTVDHVVIENGTKANADVYEALKAQSKNHGEIDINALADGELKLPKNNPEGSFDLVRVGDAVSSRNIHAAIYDALRVASFY
ncbi:MAG: 2,4-dienoyl-CoA reductase-like NADH-dependent reductase (Old Yellow Enzyme family) [Cocleimonas sp.]|jgi:2,4-dienoyl-CoA reductase-like NADH-dependent reductase (Old Yellow Enzyme family)/NADPH-dependent 2,4-dienoyl-CoA reductase/sulfur reductase-like enzyme